MDKKTQTVARKASDEINKILDEPLLRKSISSSYNTTILNTTYEELFLLWNESFVVRQGYEKDENTQEIQNPTIFTVIQLNNEKNRRANHRDTCNCNLCKNISKISDERLLNLVISSDENTLRYREISKTIYNNTDKTDLKDQKLFKTNRSIDIEYIKEQNDYSYYSYKKEVQDKILHSINELFLEQSSALKNISYNEKVYLLKTLLEEKENELFQIFNDNYLSVYNPKLILNLDQDTNLILSKLSKVEYEKAFLNLQFRLLLLQKLGFDILILINRKQNKIGEDFKELGFDFFKEEAYGLEVEERHSVKNSILKWTLIIIAAIIAAPIIIKLAFVLLKVAITLVLTLGMVAMIIIGLVWILIAGVRFLFRKLIR